MKYLIKSNKWSKHYNSTTWWGKNENGYSLYIKDAGTYTQEDVVRIQKRSQPNDLEIIPYTQEMVDKGIKELVLLQDEQRKAIYDIQKQIDRAKNKIIDYEREKGLIEKVE